MMRKLTLLGAAALVLFSCAAGENSLHRYALVYGVSYYAAPVTLPGGGVVDVNLTFPAADADSVAAMFVAEGYDSVVERISDASGNEYCNGVLSPGEGPTKANISADLSALSAGPDDLVVFYYSGHGTKIPDEATGDEWILPLASVSLTPLAFPPFYSTSLSQSAAISDHGLADMLSAIPTPRKVVILDSCFSGGFVGNVLETDRTPDAYGTVSFTLSPAVIAAAISNYENYPVPIDAISPYGNALVISASGSDEYSYDSAGFHHGAMTNYFLSIQDHGDLNGDGVVTVMEAYSLTKAGIDEGWNKDKGIIDEGMQFEPHVSGGPVDYVLF